MVGVHGVVHIEMNLIDHPSGDIFDVQYMVHLKKLVTTNGLDISSLHCVALRDSSTRWTEKSVFVSMSEYNAR